LSSVHSNCSIECSLKLTCNSGTFSHFKLTTSSFMWSLYFSVYCSSPSIL
jgi:hypothetical protein